MTVIQETEEAMILKLSMQTLKEHYGLNPGKHTKSARGIGFQLGCELAKQIVSRELYSVMDELAEFWQRNQIGEMHWEDKENNLVSIAFCSDCIGRSYGAGYTLCPFKEGLIEAVLSSRLDQKVRVKEIECCGTRAESCLFKIELEK